MATRLLEDQRAAGCEKIVQQDVPAKPSVSASDPMDVVFDGTARVDGAKRIGVLEQLEVLAKRQSSRIAFKAKGTIYFMELADIIAVQAEGNYVSLQHRTNLYLLRESLSSIAEKLKPYGFVRIHRSVLVNTSLVEEIQPLFTGEYRLRVKGGKEYMVTRTYKDNLRFLAHLWLGAEGLFSGPEATNH